MSNKAAELGLLAEDIAKRAELERAEVLAVLDGRRSTPQARRAVEGVFFEAALAAQATGWR